MAEKTTMNDVNEPIESKDSAPQEEKRRFAKLRHFNEKRAQNTDKYKKLNLWLMILFPVFIVSMAEINRQNTLFHILNSGQSVRPLCSLTFLSQQSYFCCCFSF